jgi:hypothetical protein
MPVADAVRGVGWVIVVVTMVEQACASVTVTEYVAAVNEVIVGVLCPLFHA